MLKKDNVGVAFFGDGASNNGAFHEGINLAAIWDLPVIFVCENNMYATEVPISQSGGNPDVGARGAAYGIPGVIVDGNDVLAVYEAAGEAVRRARAGEGPTLIEGKPIAPLPRRRDAAAGYVPHAGRGRSVEGARPTDHLQAAAAGWGVAPLEDFEEIEADVQALVVDAAEFAKESPYPDAAVWRAGQHFR
ncbi:MAG: thiamine pyrophosphate-dependent enzyme [Caldilineaceae bacterium]